MSRRRRSPISARSAAAALLALAFASTATAAAGELEEDTLQQQQQQPQSVPLECKDSFDLGGRKYNFSELGKRTYDVVSSDGNVNYHYAIRLCEKLPVPESQICADARICEASQAYSDGTPVLSFKQLAGNEQPPTVAVAQIDDPTGQPNVTLSFKSSQTVQHAMVMLSCKPDVDDSNAKPFLQSKDPTTIVFAWQTKLACAEAPKENPPPQKDPEPAPPPSQPEPKPQQPSTPPMEGEQPTASKPEKQGMSVVGVIFLVLLIGTAAYFLAGIYYNRTVYGAHGWDLIPHSDFWREFPSLVSDVVGHAYRSLFNWNTSGYSSMA